MSKHALDAAADAVTKHLNGPQGGWSDDDLAAAVVRAYLDALDPGRHTGLPPSHPEFMHRRTQVANIIEAVRP